MPQIPLFVINLAKSQNRRAHMQQQLGSLGLSYEFIKAVDGKAIKERDLPPIDHAFAEKLSYRKAPTKAEIGCALSHLKAYQKIVREGMEYACIMEDDVLIRRPEKLRWVLQQDNLSAVHKRARFDLIHLYMGYRINSPYLKPLLAVFPRLADREMDWFSAWGRHKIAAGLYLSRPCYPYWGTVAYIVNRRACEVFLEEAQGMIRLADILTAAGDLLGLDNYFLNPPPVGLDETIPSIITDAARFHSSFRFKEKVRARLQSVYHALGFVLAKTGLVRIERLWLKRLYSPSPPPPPAISVGSGRMNPAFEGRLVAAGQMP